MNIIKTFTKNIKNYKKIKETSNTHNISYHHERYVISKIIKSFNAIEISSNNFKDIIKINDYKLVSKPKIKLLAIFYTLALALVLAKIPWNLWFN